MVPDTDLDTPTDWEECPDEEQHDNAVVEYRRETAEGTTFLASVFRRGGDDTEYLVHLSTVDPASTPDRHDYLVEAYDSREEAIEALESFLELLSRRLQKGSVSSDNPDIDEIQDAIETFTGPSFFPSFGDLIRRLR